MGYKLYKRVGLIIIAAAFIAFGAITERPAINSHPRCIVSDPGTASNITCTATQGSPAKITLEGVPGSIYGWEHDKLTCQRPGDSFTCNLTSNHGELRINYGVNSQESEAIIQVFN